MNLANWRTKMKKFISGLNIELISRIVVGLIIVIIFSSYLISQSFEKAKQADAIKAYEEKENATVDAFEEETSKIMVHVKGEVVNPGVYEFTKDDRVKDAIEKAGGFTENANPDSVNLAEKLEDEMAITVYKKGVSSSSSSSSSKKTSSKSSSSKSKSSSGTSSTPKATKIPSPVTDNNDYVSPVVVNINTASISELMLLPGIGESTARAIVAYREEKGAFNSTEEIMRVSGIGSATYSKIKSLITI